MSLSLTPDPHSLRAPAAIRALAEADIPAVVALINAADVVDGADEGTSAAEFRLWVDGSAGAPNHFVAIAGGGIVGYADIHHRAGDEGAWGWVVVDPARREQGVGTLLAGQVRERARRLGLAWIDYAVDSRLIGANAWLGDLGFEPVRTYLRLRLETVHATPPPVYPADFRVRTFQPGADEAVVHQIMNASFADHHNVNEISMEHLAENMRQPGFDPRGLFLAETAEGRIAGLCWCYVNPDENARRGEPVGWVNDLGVARAYRRLGLGRALLLEGIGWLRQEGVACVELWMDGGNREARALYTASGFAVSKRLTDYRHYLFVPRR